MSAEESLKEGNLEQALADLQAQVRKDPANSKHRVFLFQLFCVLGQWDRALTQLNVAGEMDPLTLPMVQTYREAVQCEAYRSDVFAGRRSPLLFGEPAPWVALLLKALEHTGTGHVAEGQRLRAEAFEQADATPGQIDGQAFAWMADADPRLGPMLEAIVNGRYYWIPFHNIKRIVLEEPTDLRDLVWMAVQFEWSNGGEAVGLIPSRYCGSEASTDNQIRLGKKTEWTDRGSELFTGLGQRMLATDQGDFALLDVREIRFDGLC